MQALSTSQALIEFDLKGMTLTANENCCKALGYSLAEIVGRHHRIFCESNLVASPEYTAFWTRLAAETFDAGSYKRIAKGGRESVGERPCKSGWASGNCLDQHAVANC
nr:PAS domain-containing protein [Rhizobium halophilum]